MPKRSLRAKTGAEIVTKKVDKPVCPRHLEQMEFDPTRVLWKCPEANCNMVAHPPQEVGGPQPVSFSGPFEFMTVVNTEADAGSNVTYVLRTNKVFFDVTEMVESEKTVTGGGIKVVLHIPKHFKIDQNGNRL